MPYAISDCHGHRHDACHCDGYDGHGDCNRDGHYNCYCDRNNNRDHYGDSDGHGHIDRDDRIGDQYTFRDCYCYGHPDEYAN